MIRLDAERLLGLQLRTLRIPGLDWQPQYRFLPARRYRADWAELTHRLLVEVQGGQWVQGRHTRGAGYEADCERMCQAAIHGWAMLYVTTGMVTDGRAMMLIEQWYIAYHDRAARQLMAERSAE